MKKRVNADIIAAILTVKTIQEIVKTDKGKINKK